MSVGFLPLAPVVDLLAISFTKDTSITDLKPITATDAYIVLLITLVLVGVALKIPQNSSWVEFATVILAVLLHRLC